MALFIVGTQLAGVDLATDMADVDLMVTVGTGATLGVARTAMVDVVHMGDMDVVHTGDMAGMDVDHISQASDVAK